MLAPEREPASRLRGDGVAQRAGADPVISFEMERAQPPRALGVERIQRDGAGIAECEQERPEHQPQHPGPHAPVVTVRTRSARYGPVCIGRRDGLPRQLGRRVARRLAAVRRTRLRSRRWRGGRRRARSPRQEMTPASFQRPMSSQEQPSSSSTSSVCAPASCAGLRTAGGLAGELDRVGAHLHRPVGRRGARAGSRSPAPAGRRAGRAASGTAPRCTRWRAGAPPTPRATGWRSSATSSSRIAPACSRRASARGIALEDVGSPDGRGEDRPEALRLQHHEDEPLAVGAEVGADERVRRARHVARGGQHEAVHERGGDVGRQHPERGAEERDVDLEPLAGAFALEERGRDPARDRHAADEVAERRPLLERRLAGGGQAIGDAAARPEGDPVVAAAARVGTAASLARAAGVDQPRVDRAQVVPRDAQALARVVEEAGEEDVGARDQAIEQRAAVGRARDRCRCCACCVRDARRRSCGPTRPGSAPR